MKSKLLTIKQWLGSGAINIFGIQFAGKDTLGIPLATQLTGEFLSSGDLVRAAARLEQDRRIRQAALDSQLGVLTPTDEFQQLIVPHLKDATLAGKPLVLGSVGRWIGEEKAVMAALLESNHPLKAVIVLHISEEEVWRRWQIVKQTRNGGRADDKDSQRVRTRLAEFYDKTKPVIQKYTELGYVIDVDATGTIQGTFQTAIDQLYQRALADDITN